MKHLALAVLYDPIARAGAGLAGDGRRIRENGAGPRSWASRSTTIPAYRDAIREYLDRRVPHGRQGRRPVETRVSGAIKTG